METFAPTMRRAGEVVLDRLAKTVRPSLTGVLAPAQIGSRRTTELQLPANSFLRMEGTRWAMTIFCRSGLCWITVEGDPRDYVLHEKESLTILRDGLVVVQALADTEIVVTPDREARISARPSRASISFRLKRNRP